MPRAPFRRQQRGRLDPKPRVANTSGSSPRVELERKLANKPVGQRPVDSDDSDKLVTKASGERSRRSVPRKEIFASGAVAKDDIPGSYPSRTQRRRNTPQTSQTGFKQAERASSQRQAPVSEQKSPLLPRSSPLRPQADEQADSLSLGRNAGKPTKRGSTLAGHLPIFSGVTAAEPSILGSIKPRRRQPSILQSLDDSTLSSLDPEDEERFLPDDESTPVHMTRPAARPAALTSLLFSSGTRKRKLGASEPFQLRESPKQGQDITPAAAPTAVVPQATLASKPSSLSQSTLKAKRSEQRRSLQTDEEIMALPASSSPEPSPATSKPASPVKSKQQRQAALSTSQLQSLMPTKRRKTTRPRPAPSAFDIPEDPADGSPSAEAEVEGDESFLPRRTRNRPKGPAKSQTTKSKGQPGATKKSTRTVSVSGLKTGPRNHTKSPQPAIVSRHDISPDKSSGGFLRNAETETETDTGDKENQSSNAVSEHVAKTKTGTKSATKQNKWAEIDAWSMDFEDVEVMTGSSSPLRR